MLTSIVRFSLRFKGIIIALAFILVGYGLYVSSRARYDVFPEFAPPQAVIQTEAPGLSPEQVELIVTQPIENALNGVAGIDSLRSSSIQGLSIVTVTFQPNTDIYRDRQVVAERLASLTGQLPQGIKAPILTPLTSSTSVTLVIGLESEKRSLMEVRTVADWVVKQRILSVPGVAKVAVFGGEVRQIQVQVIPDRLIKYNLTVEDILSAAGRATGVKGAGFIDNDNQRIVLQTEGQTLTAGEISRTVLTYHNGANVTLGDAAKVIEGHEPLVGTAAINGHKGVVMVISGQYGANTLDVTQKVEAAIEELRPTLNSESIALHADLFRPANFIQTAIHNVKSSMLLGSVLVIIVLFLFLFNLRTAAISCTAIPLSLLAGVTVLEYLGLSLNTMTLGGLAIAVGEVVDDAVIDVENIFRRMRENQLIENPMHIFNVVLDASIEVRSAVVYATIAVVIVFVPILTLSGLAGRIFTPLGIAYISAVLASLIVALTVTPALSLLFLGSVELSEKEPPVAVFLKERYKNLLLRVERHPWIVVGAVAVFLIAGLSTMPFLGGGFLPELKEGHFIIHMSAVPGTSLDESLRIGGRVSQELLKKTYIRSVTQRVGRAEKSDDVFGTHYSEFEVDMKPLKGEESEIALMEIRKTLSGFPGVNFAVKTFLTERVEETLSGYTASVVVNIFGNDLSRLDEKAREVATVLNRVQGATEVMVQSPPGTPQLIIRPRKEDLLRWGFNPLEVLNVIRTAYQGDIVGQIYDGNRVFDVSVILDPSYRRSPADIGELPLRNPVGTYIRLRQIADIYETSGRYVVLHDGARRVQTVTANVSGRDVNPFIAEAKREIQSKVTLPPGMYIEFTGTAEAQARSRRDIILHSLLAGIGIILLLSVVTGHYRNLLLILLNLPFALVGGVFMVFATGGFLSLGSLVGFVTLFGITLRNSIMMISHFEHLVFVEGLPWGLDTMVRGASERFIPILMTALVTALGLLPLAIGAGEAGREIEGPMAQVILGGLLTSTALNLLVLPTLAFRYARFRKMDI